MIGEEFLLIFEYNKVETAIHRWHCKYFSENVFTVTLGWEGVCNCLCSNSWLLLGLEVSCFALQIV